MMPHPRPPPDHFDGHGRPLHDLRNLLSYRLLPSTAWSREECHGVRVVAGSGFRTRRRASSRSTSANSSAAKAVTTRTNFPVSEAGQAQMDSQSGEVFKQFGQGDATRSA